MTRYSGGALHTEDWGIAGGSAGDQGGEVTSHVLSYDWTYVLRPPHDGALIAYAMGAACRNQAFGYDQAQRTTGYDAIVRAGDPARVTTPCEVDCSSLVAACCAVAGFDVPSEMWTGDEIETLTACGFRILTFDYDSLRVGDVLLRSGHTEIYLGDVQYPPKPTEVPVIDRFPAKWRFDRTVRVRTAPNAHDPSTVLQGYAWHRGDVCDNIDGIAVADGCTWARYRGRSTGLVLYAAMTQDGVAYGEVV